MAAPIALQLYTVRDALAHNFKSVVTRIAEIGYVGVETAGFPGIGVDEASDLFADLGLDVCSVHTQLPLGKTKKSSHRTGPRAGGHPRGVLYPARCLRQRGRTQSTLRPLEPSRRYRRRERIGTGPPQSLVGISRSGRESGLCTACRSTRRVHLLPSRYLLGQYRRRRLGAGRRGVGRASTAFAHQKTARAIPSRTCSPSAKGLWISRPLSRPATAPVTG